MGVGVSSRRRGGSSKNRQYRRARRTKRSAIVPDLDMIVLKDMQPEETKKLMNQKSDEDKPGLAQHYCVPCARHFISDPAMKVHMRQKEHKKRVKVCLTEVPYTIEESQKAGGMNVDVSANRIAAANQASATFKTYIKESVLIPEATATE